MRKKASAGRPKRVNSVRVHSILDTDLVESIRELEPRDLAWSYKLNRILRQWYEATGETRKVDNG